MIPTSGSSHTEPLGEQFFLAYLFEKSALRLVSSTWLLAHYTNTINNLTVTLVATKGVITRSSVKFPYRNFSENFTVASGRHDFNLSTHVTILLIYTGDTQFGDPQCEQNGYSENGIFLFLLSVNDKSL